MMRRLRKIIYVAIVAALTANTVLLGGCGKEDGIGQMGAEGQGEGVEVLAEEIPIVLGAAQEESGSADRLMRSYSEEEKERMEALKQSYESEEAYPENLIAEVDSAEQVTEGELCYIRSTGEFYLPDRDLTDEELLEIIDCNFRIALGSNHKTQAEYEEEDRQKRAMLEEKVQAAGGISEEKALEIGKKAMAADLGERGKNLIFYMFNEKEGWSTDLCVADWSEIKEKDKGEIAYYMSFGSEVYEGMNLEDMSSYHCTVSAVDGHILEAYEFVAGEDWDKPVYYEH